MQAVLLLGPRDLANSRVLEVSEVNNGNMLSPRQAPVEDSQRRFFGFWSKIICFAEDKSSLFKKHFLVWH